MSTVRYLRQSETSSFRLLNACLVRLREQRKLIYVAISATLVVSVGVAVFAPPRMTASAKVMPSTINSSGPSLGALIPGAAMLSQMATQVNVYLELLKSTHVQDSVLARYGITPQVEPLSPSGRLPCDHTVGTITDGVREAVFSANMKSGVVTVIIATKDAELSADLANTFVNCLDERLQQLDRILTTKTGGYLDAQVVEQRKTLYGAETRMADYLARNRNYVTSDDPDLRIELGRLEMDVEFNRALLRTLLEIKAKNDLELGKSIPRLMVVEWAAPPQPVFPIQRIKNVIMATLGAGVFAIGLIVLRTAWLWYIPAPTRQEFAQSIGFVGRDAQQVINRIRRPLKTVNNPEA